jgi:hypothetical protein
METFTITFSECVENHVGMQNVGTKNLNGLTTNDLKLITNQFKNTELYNIKDLLSTTNIESSKLSEVNDAYVLVIRNGLKQLNINELNNEIFNIKDKVDKQALMRGRVCNKHARWNLCFADIDQEPDIKNGKGTLISFNHMKQLSLLRIKLSELNSNLRNLFAELNYYYDITKCGIGYHGDTERRIVVGVRLGATMPLCYHWFYKHEKIGNKLEIQLNDGDIYFMNDKAVGNDWKSSSKYTLRHSAGCDKFTDI